MGRGHFFGVAIKRLGKRFNDRRPSMLATLLFLIERPLLSIKLAGKGLSSVKGLYSDLDKPLISLLPDGRHMVVIRSQFSRKFSRSLGKHGNDPEIRLTANPRNGKINYLLGNIWESCYGADGGTWFVNLYQKFMRFKSQFGRNIWNGVAQKIKCDNV